MGTLGEDAACTYFEQNGYTVLHRNYKVRGGEIDIIADDNGTVVFAEVKTRSSNKYGSAAEAVDAKKISRMCVAAERYIFEHGLQNSAVRFDVIEVYTNSPKPLLNHIKCIDIN